jgi:RNA polymerase sigma-32 factor
MSLPALAKTTLPALSGDASLAQYMAQIRRFPVLAPQEEYMLATYASWPKSPWAIAATACRWRT